MKTLVLGGGATGLAAAYFLNRAGHEVTVLEAAEEVGGLLSSVTLGDEAPVERFYHHVFTHDEELRWLVGELGLDDRLEYYDGSMAVLRQGRCHPFDGPLDVLTFPGLRPTDRVRFGLSAALLTAWPRYETVHDVAALEWLGRWAGERATATVWEPLFRAKFGSVADRVPLAWLAGRLRQRVRSRSGAGEKLGYFVGGFQRLVDCLVGELRANGVDVRTGCPVEEFMADGGGVRGVRTEEGSLEAERVFSTLPTPILARLLEPVDAGYSRSLASIDYMGAVCSVLLLEESVAPAYWLNVLDEDVGFTVVVEHTRLVPPSHYSGKHVLYLARYAEHDDPVWKVENDAWLERQLRTLSEIVDGEVLTGGILDHRTFRARFAAPVTDLDFHRRIPAFDAPVSGLYVASMPHVYPDERSTNNSIRIARAVVEAAGVDTPDMPRGPSLAASYGWSPADER